MIFTIIFLVLFNPAQTNYWEVLSKVDVIKSYDQILGYEVDIPIFNEAIKELEGERISLTGYMMPVDSKSSDYILLSSLPYASCFFCGGAGPETVVEVNLMEELSYTNKLIKIEGYLELNDQDPLHLFYILTGARLVK
ncbi:MAG TPA: hypothetical protein ACFCUD_13430 [Cyclobacteriaceae bacterium]